MLSYYFKKICFKCKSIRGVDNYQHVFKNVMLFINEGHMIVV